LRFHFSLLSAHPAAYALSKHAATGGLTSSELDRKEKRRRERAANPLATLAALPDAHRPTAPRLDKPPLKGPLPPLLVVDLGALSVEGSLQPLLVARKDQVVLLFEQAVRIEARRASSHRFDLVRQAASQGTPPPGGRLCLLDARSRVPV